MLVNNFNKSIAVLCNYRLDTNRIGGMDYFFWEFDNACKINNYQITWFFPNQAEHGLYPNMNIITVAEGDSIENCFLNNIKQYHFDYVITHFLELCTPFFKKVKLLKTAKIIAVDHNPRPLGGYSLRKKMKKVVYSLLFGRFIDLFVAVSDQTRNDLHNDFPFVPKLKTLTIYNGLPVNNIKVKDNKIKSKIYFMVCSHLRIEKGVKDIIEAVNKLSRGLHSKMIIDIYGDGPEMENLNNLIIKYKLQEVIFMKGSSDKTHKLYSKYDYLVHPSHSETFCYTVVESLLANVPVITTENAGNILGLVSKKNGFIYPIGDITQLSKQIKNILNEKVLLINTREEIEEKFSIENMVNNYISIL